ncbi:13E12 repeat family protein, partial [Mycobacterium szulgai]
DWLNPDGNYTDEDRARKRGLSLGKQEHDGMSRLSGYVDPELRATLEAVEAKLAAPGMCNRDDEAPVVDDQPSAEAARRDLRSKP